MVKRMDDLKFPWLYLYDETQKAAKDFDEEQAQNLLKKPVPGKFTI